jgi:hypothetical protein
MNVDPRGNTCSYALLDRGEHLDEYGCELEGGSTLLTRSR